LSGAETARMAQILRTNRVKRFESDASGHVEWSTGLDKRSASDET